MSTVTASFRKLPSGVWGIQTSGPVPAGSQVQVRKASGEVSTVTVEQILETRPNGCLCSIVSTRPQAAKAAPAVRQTPRWWRPCGYPGCSSQYCDECDGEGYRSGR